MSDPHTTGGIDPRGPRSAATVTAALLLVAVFLGLTGISTAHATASFGWFADQPLDDAFVAGSGWAIASASLLQRALDPGFLLLAAISVLFLWGVAWPKTHPYAGFFRAVIRPRLAAPAELEDPRPPRFAQGVGLLVTGAGILLHLAGVPWALPIAAAAAFVAAFLNAAFGLCLGCQLYLLLQRVGAAGRPRSA